MNFDGRYESAVSRCETIARNQGHIPGVWQPVDERLHAIVCEGCSMISWVSRSGEEERWRMGGQALKQECLAEDAAIGNWASTGALRA